MGLKDYIEANEHTKDDDSGLPFFPFVVNHSNAQSVEIEEYKLHDFSGHTFKLRPDRDPYIISLKASIKKNGILEPLLVRPHPAIPGHYEIIAGHTRRHIGLEVGLVKLPCIVKQLSDDDAIIQMGESNVQRPDWLPSEKAKTYAVHLEATRRKTGVAQGQRTDLTSPTGSAKLRNDDEAAKTWGISGDSLRMYIKLNDLLPELLDLVDAGRVPVKAGYQLAFLQDEQQQLVLSVMQEHPKKKLPDSKAKELRQAAMDGELTREYILRLLGVQKQQMAERQVSISFTSTELLNPRTTRAALNDPIVLESIERILIEYAQKHSLPLR